MSDFYDYRIFLNSLPSSWTHCRFKDVYQSKKEVAGEAAIKYERLALTLGGVIKRSKEDDKGLQPTNFETYQIIKANDMVFKMIDLNNISTSRVGLTSWDGLVSPVYLRFVPKYNDPGFMYYYFMSLYYQNVFNNIAGDGVRSALSATDIGNIECPLPKIQEQKAIVQVLNRNVQQINKLISNQERQIEKLKEYRQAIITKAVTKGLDPNAPMKDSGVEWIGKIKHDYHCEKLKFLLSSPMLYGANESGGKQEKGCTRFIRITDIDSNGNLKDTNDNQYLSASKSTGYILKNKDILFARSGGTVGKSFLYKNPGFPCSFAGYLIKAECEETLLLPEFLYYYTKSSLYEIWKNMIFVQSTIQNIGAQRYGNLDIVIPSIAEQKQIVQYIDKKCMLIDKLIDIKNRTRKQLIDFKKSLIYEYVTGKKRVSL